MNSDFSTVLKGLRRKKGLTQDTVAKEINVSQRAYAHYEAGDRQPNIETLIKLADFFDVPVDLLIGRYVMNNTMINNVANHNQNSTINISVGN